MKDIFNTIINSAKKFSLTEGERKLLTERVFSYIKENPLLPPANPITSPYLGFWGLMKNKLIMPALVMLLLVSGGGTTLRANSALPGEALYGIKININEKVESLLAFGVGEAAKVEVKQINTRLEEVEELSVKGKISPEIKDEIKINFNKKVDKVKELSADIKESGEIDVAASVNSEFESTLRVHNLVLTELSENDEANRGDIEEINMEVNVHLADAEEARSEEEEKIISLEDQASLKLSAEKSLSAAKEKIRKEERYISAQKTVVRDLKAKAFLELEAAKGVVLEGEKKQAEESYGEALILFNKAIRMAEEARLILHSENKLNINIEETPIEGGEDAGGQNDPTNIEVISEAPIDISHSESATDL